MRSLAASGPWAGGRCQRGGTEGGSERRQAQLMILALISSECRKEKAQLWIPRLRISESSRF